MTQASVDPHKFITLENNFFRCCIMPQLGGAVRFFDCKIAADKTQPLLRSTTQIDSTDVLDFALWPLVPFSNRIKHGVFEFDGTTYKIESNYLGGPNGIHASHGQGWMFPWKIEHADQTECSLSFSFNPIKPDMTKLWPFPYDARLTYKLNDNGLSLRISAINTGCTNMPIGLGTHPYFHKTPGTTLQAQVKGLWQIDDEVIPTHLVPVPAEYDFAVPKSLDNARLDSCFNGYGGQMQIVWPEAPVGLNVKSSPNLDHFVVYTPQGENFFCAEPISHKPNAINDTDWTGNGLRILSPGQTTEAWYEYEALRLPNADDCLARFRPLSALSFGLR